MYTFPPLAPGVFAVMSGDRPVRREAFFAALADGPLGAPLGALLTAQPWAAFCWETPPLSPRSRALPAAFAVVESPALARVSADPSPFAAQLAGAPVATFENLGGDALLVAPRPELAPGAAHLAAFLRGAPPAVVDAFWRAVGRAALGRLAAGRTARRARSARRGPHLLGQHGRPRRELAPRSARRSPEVLPPPSLRAPGRVSGGRSPSDLTPTQAERP